MNPQKGSVIWWVIIAVALIVIGVLVFKYVKKSDQSGQTAMVVQSTTASTPVVTSIDDDFAAIDADLTTINQDNASIDTSLNDSQPNLQ